jgi:integrase
MRLFMRGKIWYCWFYIDGKQTQRSTRTGNRKAAELCARKWERAAADPAHAATEAATLSDAIRLLLTERRAQASGGKRSEYTVTFYESKCGHLVRVLNERGESRLMDITAARVRAYITTRRSESASESTIHKELIALRSALRIAKEHGIWRGDIGEVIPSSFSPEYQPRERWLTRDELQRLLTKLEPDRAARIAFIVATGARWRETELARREDVARDRSSVRLRGTKTAGANRVVPIVGHDFHSLLVLAMKHANGADGVLFGPWTSPVLTLRRACRDAKIPVCTPNDLRRTTASWMIQADVPNHVVAKILGHKTTRMVDMVYGRVSLESLRDSLAKHLGGCNAGARQPAQLPQPTQPMQLGSGENSPQNSGDQCPGTESNRRHEDFQSSALWCVGQEKHRAKRITKRAGAMPVQEVRRTASATTTRKRARQ